MGAEDRKGLRALWARRWFRRTTYTLVSGAVVLGVASWTIQRPFFTRWALTRLDETLRDETGLGLRVEGLELRLLEGRVIATRVSLGEDLFQAERVDASVYLGSLLMGDLHIRRLDLDRPSVLLNSSRLARLRLKARPPRTTKTQWQVDQVTIRDGRITVQEPAWGIPTFTSSFSVHGQGQGSNRVKVFLDTTDLRVGEGPAALNGQLAIRGEFNDGVVSIARGELKLGNTHAAWQGRYETETEKLTSSASGGLDLGQLGRLLAPKAGEMGGVVAFKTEAWGQARQPPWKLALDGRGLESTDLKLRPGSLELRASGTPAYASIHRVAWTSPDGALEAEGTWKRGEGSRLQVQGRQVGLGPLADLAKADFLRPTVADLEGEAFIPGDPWKKPPLNRLRVDLQVRLSSGGLPAGGAKVQLEDGRLVAELLRIDLPEFQFKGQGRASLGRRGLREITGEGTTNTDAAVVAKVLGAWGIGDKEDAPGKDGKGRPKFVIHPFKMAGQAHVQALARWNSAEGLVVSGECEVLEPCWHGAQADQLRTPVTIQGGELRLEKIELIKGEGRGWGELWLSMTKLPHGQDEIDMCFRAFRLPVSEGLKAADLDPKIIQVEGVGGGWVRIHGPYEQLRLEGAAQAEDTTVYGLQIPALSGDFSMDLERQRLQVQDLRVGESLAALGQGEDPPAGLLSLQGAMDMDYGHRTWQASLKGDVDSLGFGLTGPRFQARIEANLEGPWTQPLGITQLPLGQVTLRGGRVFLGSQSLEGLEGSLEHGSGGLVLSLGMLGKERPVLGLNAWDTPQGLVGLLELHVGPDTADTAHLATRLSRDLLQDLRMEAAAEGTWNEQGLEWKGGLHELVCTFDGFALSQEGQTTLRGDAVGATVDLRLTGQSQQEPSLASFRASGRVPFSGKAPLGLKLEGSAELAKLKPIADHLMELDSYSLLGDLGFRGAAKFELALGGSYKDPSLDGTLDLKGGSLEVRGYPQSIEDLDFKLHFKGREILLPEEAPARGLFAQGDLTFWGKATWGFGGFESYDLRASLKDFEFRDIPEGFELQGDLNGRLRGTDRGGLLTGSLLANHMLYRAEINLSDLLLSNAMRNLGGSSGLDPEDPLARIGLDLDLRLSEPWSFDTNLLKLQGRLAPGSRFKVRGTLTNPTLQGKIDFIPGGRVTNLLPAGDIVVERGSITFSELGQSFNPQLDILGRVDVSPYVVTLQIRGSLDSLEFSPTSTPALRRDEITAILIDPSLAPTIGSTSGSSSAISYGMAKTSGGLLTTLALADIQERVRRTFNLDRVNVAWRPGSAGNSESTVTLGKTLTFPSWKLPLVFTHKTVGEVTTLSGQVEWRIGNLVFQLGLSQSGSTGLNPAGEIRHTWSPK